jgi:hypothetical protein
MTALEKLKIMKVANWLMDQLLYNGDPDFTDRVLSAIGCAEPFSEEEMQEITMSEYCEEA